MASNLPSLPPPGISLFPSYTATKPETFLITGFENFYACIQKPGLICFSNSAGEAGSVFLEMHLDKKQKVMVFKTPKSDGAREVMRVAKESHMWSGKAEYHGMRGEADEVWCVGLKLGLKGTEYNLTVPSHPGPWTIQNKVQGQDKGILLNNQPVTTMSIHEQWKHIHRRDLIHIAPGMDLLLALGVAWVRLDKQLQDTRRSVAAGAASASAA